MSLLTLGLAMAIGALAGWHVRGVKSWERELERRADEEVRAKQDREEAPQEVQRPEPPATRPAPRRDVH